MKLLRLALTVASLGLLALGYAASQFYALTGRAAQYSTLIDVAPVRWLALLLFIGAVVLCFVPEPEERR